MEWRIEALKFIRNIHCNTSSPAFAVSSKNTVARNVNYSVSDRGFKPGFRDYNNNRISNHELCLKHIQLRHKAPCINMKETQTMPITEFVRG